MSDAAVKLDEAGYTMLACRSVQAELLASDILRPYKTAMPVLVVLQWLGMLMYFLSTSDSSSFVNDMMAAGGLSRPPLLQRVYW